MSEVICNNNYDDLGDDFWLAEGFEEEGEGAAEEQDESGLHNEEREGEVEWVVSLPHPVGGGLDGGYVYGHGCRPLLLSISL